MKVLIIIQFIPLAMADNLTSIIVQLMISLTTIFVFYAAKKRSINRNSDNCRNCYYYVDYTKRHVNTHSKKDAN